MQPARHGVFGMGALSSRAIKGDSSIVSCVDPLHESCDSPEWICSDHTQRIAASREGLEGV